MRRRNAIALAIVVALSITATPQDTWENTPKGRVSGTLSFAKPRPRQPLVVYLERTSRALAFSPPAGELVIRQSGAKFDPPFVAILVGQTVAFDNDEAKEIDHNVYTLGAESRDFGIFPRGNRVVHTFATSGEVQLHCSIHKFMDGKLFVAPTPAFTVVGEDEIAFSLSDVPEGTYVLKTYQKAKRFRDAEIPLQVRAGEITALSVEMTR